QNQVYMRFISCFNRVKLSRQEYGGLPATKLAPRGIKNPKAPQHLRVFGLVFLFETGIVSAVLGGGTR
ncbi:MAG TPA: hypothetical protein H9898_00825, partial [Candidatus Anaerobiospirillum stercoravium]|nr:hypothetical protein [Candidatus Anaerobiospirillum stercoravium]